MPAKKPRPLTPLSQDLVLTFEEAGVRKFYFETLGVLTPADAPDPYMQAFYGLVDNMGDILTISPILMEKYLSAAERIGARAIGADPLPKPLEALCG